MCLFGCVCLLCVWAHACVLTNRFFKAVRQPAVPQHSDYGRGRTFQVLERIHQDEVQHDVKEVHRDHLQGAQEQIHSGQYKPIWDGFLAKEEHRKDDISMRFP